MTHDCSDDASTWRTNHNRTAGTEFGCDWTRKALAEAQIGEDARGQILHRNAAAMLARAAKTAQREKTAA